MNTYASKKQQTRTAVRTGDVTGAGPHFADQRPQAALQRKWQAMAGNNPRVQQLKSWQNLADTALQRKKIAQLQGKLEEEELLQGKFDPIQKMDGLEEEELLQGKFEPVQRKENNTGLPDNLKSGIENLSGLVLDDVQVHYNSAKPSQLQAHAYAQGKDIHVAPGQEKHLSHEAWHVVQQKQGRVQPTIKLKGQNVNDDTGLEREADEMGSKASRFFA